MPAEVWLDDSEQDEQDGVGPGCSEAILRVGEGTGIRFAGHTSGQDLRWGVSGGSEKGRDASPGDEARTSPCTPVEASHSGALASAFVGQKSPSLTSMLAGMRRGVGVRGRGWSSNNSQTARSLSRVKEGLGTGHGVWQRTRGGEGGNASRADVFEAGMHANRSNVNAAPGRDCADGTLMKDDEVTDQQVAAAVKEPGS